MIDLSELKPTVSFPHLPSNTKTIDQVGEVKIDQAVIGSCTNGRMDDMRAAAEVLKGRKVAKGVRCIVIPATQAIYLQAMREGLLEIFIEAGAVVSTPNLRTLPGRLYGYSGCRRAVHFHHKQELCGPYGPCGFRGVSGQPGCGGCQRGGGENYLPLPVGLTGRRESYESMRTCF